MASGFLGFLGKKKQSEVAPVPAAPEPVVRGLGSTPPPGAPLPPSAVPTGPMPVAPRPAGSGPLFERARKRVTQRLSLAGLSSAAPGTGKIKIPAAAASTPEPSSVPIAPVEAVVEIPASVFLSHIPEAVLLASAAELAASAQAQSNFRLPLGTILPMLPSGKVEVTVGDLATWAPEGVMHPPEVLGEWAAQVVSLPLPQIVMRIPPEMMVLRRDQKQVDSMVLSMDDPFSPEALKAKAEAARAAAEAEAAAVQAAMPSVSVPEVESGPAVIPEPEPQANLPEGSPWEVTAPLPSEAEPVPQVTIPESAATAYIPEPPVLLAEEVQTQVLPHVPVVLSQQSSASGVETGPQPASPPSEPDFSFTQSPEYLALLAKLNQAEESAKEEVASEPASSAKPGVEDGAEAAPSSAPPDFASVEPSFQFTSGAASPSEVTEPTPEDEVIRSPLAAAVEATSPGFGSAFTKALEAIGKKADAAPVQTEPAPAPGVPVSSSSDSNKVEDMRSLLKLAPGAPAEIKDVVHHIGLWPGVDACIICGLDGLAIASFAPPGRTVPQVSAVAPKLLKTLATLFTDLGHREPSELAVPCGEETLHFFRHDGMIMILSSGEASIPPVYRRTIRDVLALLSHTTAKF